RLSPGPCGSMLSPIQGASRRPSRRAHHGRGRRAARTGAAGAGPGSNREGWLGIVDIMPKRGLGPRRRVGGADGFTSVAQVIAEVPAAVDAFNGDQGIDGMAGEGVAQAHGGLVALLDLQRSLDTVEAGVEIQAVSREYALGLVGEGAQALERCIHSGRCDAF